MTPFDYVKQIQTGKQDLMTDDLPEKEYVPFVVNRTLSYELDTIIQANEMNQRAHCDKRMQYHYLLSTIRSRKRPYHQWSKVASDDVIDDIKLFYECSTKRALEYLDLLTPAQLAEIDEKTDPGGRTGRKIQKV